MTAPAAEDLQILDWLQGMAEGDEGALVAFYRALQGRVYGFALQRLAEPAAAAEVLNEVMLEVWRSAGRFEGRSRPLTWVLGIAHHKIVDKLRAGGRHRAEELDPELMDADAAEACDLVAAAQHSELVRRCLEKLTAVQRQVVHLTFFEDLSYPEIARIMSCPEGTVKTRMFHAKAALRRCLADLLDPVRA